MRRPYRARESGGGGTLGVAQGWYVKPRWGILRDRQRCGDTGDQHRIFPRFGVANPKAPKVPRIPAKGNALETQPAPTTRPEGAPHTSTRYFTERSNTEWAAPSRLRVLGCREPTYSHKRNTHLAIPGFNMSLPKALKVPRIPAQGNRPGNSTRPYDAP